MTGPAAPPGGEKGWCLNCNEWGDPDPRRAHPASECPWRPVPPGAEELRKAIARALAPFARQVSIALVTDAVLALPEMRDALAAQETVRRVEATLADHSDGTVHADCLRRALAGEP